MKPVWRGLPTWQRQAECNGSTLDFTSTRRAVVVACLQVCSECVVMLACRAWADSIGDVVSVLGGETPMKRHNRHLRELRQAWDERVA